MTATPQPPHAASAPGSALSPELVEALEAHGAGGARAANLLKAAERILATPSIPAADEAAQSCCRGALESLLKLAGEDFPGPRKATERLVEQAKTVAEARRSGSAAESAEVEELVNAVDALHEQEQDQGGFRVRQINQLVLEQTGREMGAAEQLAARQSWSAFYSAASQVLHGSRKGKGAQDLFDGVVMTIQNLFLGLPERAESVRALALLADPRAEDAAEVAMWTDPRAGEYFFRTASSPDWLDLLPPERLLPESGRWLAVPYVRRLLHAEPQRVCDWLLSHLTTVQQRGTRALSAVAGLAGEAGMTAQPLINKILKGTQDVDVLLSVAFWARDVPPTARTRRWVNVVEQLLNSPDFTEREEWECGQLLHALQQAAYPEGAPRHDGTSVTEGVRYALATAVGLRLTDPASQWRADLVNDLSTPAAEGAPDSNLLVPLLRGVLDLALADARAAVPLEVRWKPTAVKVQAGPVSERLLAVHLREARTDDANDQDRDRAWWQAAVPLAGRLVRHRSPRADVADFLHLLLQQCPAVELPRLEQALRQGLGPAPSAAEVDAWRHARANNGPPLPHRWNTARTLSPVLTEVVLAAWRPLLGELEGLAGPPAARPEPRMQISVWRETASGLSTEPYAELARTEGAAAATRALLDTPLPRGGDDPGFAYGGLITELVAQDAPTWAADPPAVSEALGDPELQAYYFQALRSALQDGSLSSAQGPAAMTETAFAARPADETADGADNLVRAICNLLHYCFNQGVDLSGIEADAVAWMTEQIQTWSRPRVAAGHHPWTSALSHSGGSALIALIAWGLNSDATAPTDLPTPLTSVLEEILNSEPDDQALAVVGLCLTQLRRRAPAWADARAGVLYSLDEDWRPARTWLTNGSADRDLLKRMDHERLRQLLCDTDSDEPRHKVLIGLLDPAEPLGPTGAFLTALAGLASGADVVSSILSSLAFRLRGDTVPPVLLEQARSLWANALDAHLPADALKGAGAFAYATALDDAVWLDLMARTTEQTVILDAAHAIARRAAEHPGVPQAYRIAAALLQTPLDIYRTGEVQGAAYSLFTNSKPDTSTERAKLRLALINCGKVEAAFNEEATNE